MLRFIESMFYIDRILYKRIDIQTHFNIYDTLVNTNWLDARIIYRDVSPLGAFCWAI